MEQRTFGFVQHYDHERGAGYGYILADGDYTSGVFFHYMNVERSAGYVTCEPGQRVSFVRGTSSKTGRRDEAQQIRFESAHDVVGEHGTVRKWVKNVFGFITADSGDDVFCHECNILMNNGKRSLVPGQRVWFQRSDKTRNGTLQAVNIMKISEETETVGNEI